MVASVQFKVHNIWLDGSVAVVPGLPPHAVMAAPRGYEPQRHPQCGHGDAVGVEQRGTVSAASKPLPKDGLGHAEDHCTHQERAQEDWHQQ